MLNNKSFIAPLLMLTGIMVVAGSCKREYTQKYGENFDMQSKAMVKVFNLALGTARNNVYVDDVPASGAAGVFSFSTAFPGTVLGFAVDPGNRNIVIKDTSLTATQPVISFSQNFEAGKYYTIFTYDTLATVKHKIMETPVVIPSDTTARLRFGNFIFSKTTVPPNVDVYSVKKAANIFTNIAVAQVTDYIPYQTDVTDTLYVRATGTTTNLTPVMAITPREKRNYTVVFKGRYQTTGTTGIARLLTTFADY